MIQKVESGLFVVLSCTLSTSTSVSEIGLSPKTCFWQALTKGLLVLCTCSWKEWWQQHRRVSAVKKKKWEQTEKLGWNVTCPVAVIMKKVGSALVYSSVITG